MATRCLFFRAAISTAFIVRITSFRRQGRKAFDRAAFNETGSSEREALYNINLGNSLRHIFATERLCEKIQGVKLWLPVVYNSRGDYDSVKP